MNSPNRLDIRMELDFDEIIYTKLTRNILLRMAHDNFSDKPSLTFA